MIGGACLALLASLAACTRIVLTPEEDAVRVTANAETVKGCKLLGEVEGSDLMNGGMIGQSAAENNAYKFLKRNARTMGANAVLLSTESTTMSGARKRGEAYSCPTP
jgi:Domain of unknown function (DUF4156)